MAVFHEDVELSIPGVGTVRGREAHRDVAAGYIEAFPDLKFAIKNVIESDDWVVVEGTYTGTHTGPMRGPQGELPPTGRTVSIDYAELFHLRGDKFDVHHVYLDQGDFMAQLGLGHQGG